MQLVDMLFDEIEDAKRRKVPGGIPIGTIEYHAHHASCGCDTMVINGIMRELEKAKEIVVCPPIWYGVASYAVGGPETGTIQVDVDVYGGFDHAGKYETSLLYALYPDHVDLARTKDNTEWFAESAKAASKDLGKHMVQCTLEALEDIIG